MSKDPNLPRSRDTISEMLLAATVRTKRSLNRPLMRAETSSRSFWVWACVLAVAWHVLFWIGLSGRRLPYPEATHASAHVSYLPGASSSRPDGRAARDTRGIWSPVLFALPSASGFSGPVLARAVSLRPPVDTPGDRSVLLPLTQLTRRPGSREVAGLQGPARLPDEFPLLPEKPPVFARAATLAAESPFHVTVSPGLTGAVNASDLLPAASGLAGEKPWEARAYVVVDEHGRVTQVLLEEPAPVSGWNEQWLRALWSMRLARSEAEWRGRVVVRYAGRQAGKTSAQGGPPG